MANLRLYQNTTDVMLASFVQATDPNLDTPNQVLPGKLWIDTTNNGWVWKRRSADNLTWITRADITADGSVTAAKIADKNVTLPKLPDLNPQSIVGRGALVGSPQNILLGTGLSVDLSGVLHAAPTLTLEEVDDRVAALIVAGANITKTYDDLNNTLTIAAAGSTGTGLTLEDVDDRVAALIIPGTNISKTYDDLNNTLTLSASGGTGGTNYVSASQYLTLAEAITAAANKTLLIDVERTITVATTVPANVLLRFINGARIIKGAASTGALAFGGIGYADSNPYVAYFSGFAEGDITFTDATNYKRQLIAQNFAAVSLSESLRIADKSVAGKHAELFAFPGTFTSRFDLTDKHTLRLSEGEFRNTFDGVNAGTSSIPAIVLHNDTRLIGAGMTRTIVYESSTMLGASNIAFATSVLNPNANGANHNIEISDICFRNSTYNRINQAYSAVSTGNAKNGHIRRCYFLGLRGFGAYIGGNGDVFGNFPEDSSITDCVFHNSAQNSVGAINGKNILIARNVFAKFGGYTMRRLDGITTNGSKILDIAASNNVEINGATNVGGFRDDMTAQFGPFGPNFVILTYPDGTKSRTIAIASRQSDLRVTLDEALDKTATGVKVDVVVGSTLAMDFEPLGGNDVLDRMIVVDNVVDARDSQSSTVFGIKLQSPATRRGVTNSIISRNIVTGDDNSLGGRNIKLTIGIEVMNADNILISDNVVQGTINAGYIVENGYQITLQNNVVAMAGAADDKAIVLTALTDSSIKGNIVRKTYSNGWLHSERIFEQELGLPVTVDADGVTVRRTQAGGGYIFLPFWVGKQVVIANVVHTVAAVLDVVTLRLSTATTPSTVAVSMVTKFSNNRYIDNEALILRIPPASLSRVHNSSGELVITALTANYTLRPNDFGKMLAVDSTVAVTITVPTGLPVGFNCLISQRGAGRVTVAAATGVTLSEPDAQLTTRKQFSSVAIISLAILNTVNDLSFLNLDKYTVSGDTAV